MTAPEWAGRVRFGDTWAGYVGPAGDQNAHAHAAVQITLALEGSVTLSSDSGELKGRAIWLNALYRHRLTPTERTVGLLYIDASSGTGRWLRERFADAGWAHLPDALAGDLLASSEPREWVALLEAQSPAAAPLDPRLRQALTHVQRDIGPGAIAEAARAAGISEARLRTLARKSIGMPITQWRLWRKLERSALALAAGASLADAAHDGGFADQAHLNRTLRRMFGITPRVAGSTLNRGA